MQIFEFKEAKIVEISGHTFQILNGFRSNGYNNNPVFLQLISTTKKSLQKEYLPANFELAVYRNEKDTIYTIWDKKFFEYQSKSESLSDIYFIGLTEQATKRLMVKWLSNYYGIEILEDKIQGFASQIDLAVHEVSQIVDNQEFVCYSVDPKHWRVVDEIKKLKGAVYA